MGRDIDFVSDIASEGGRAEIKGIGRRPPRPLHEYWSAVLVAAADTADPKTDPDEPYSVETVVYLRHGSPGWVDGFIVTLG